MRRRGAALPLLALLASAWISAACDQPDAQRTNADATASPSPSASPSPAASEPTTTEVLSDPANVFVEVEGYDYLQPPRALVRALQKELRARKPLAAAITGFEVRTLTAEEAPAALVVALAVEPSLAAAAGVRDALMDLVVGSRTVEPRTRTVADRTVFFTNDNQGLRVMMWQTGPSFTFAFGDDGGVLEDIATALIERTDPEPVTDPPPAGRATTIDVAEAFVELEGYAYRPLPRRAEAAARREIFRSRATRHAVVDVGLRSVVQGRRPVGVALAVVLDPGWAALPPVRAGVVGGFASEFGAEPEVIRVRGQTVHLFSGPNENAGLFWHRGGVLMVLLGPDRARTMSVVREMVDASRFGAAIGPGSAA